MILGKLLLSVRLCLLHRVRVNAVLPGAVAHTWRPIGGHSQRPKLRRRRHGVVGHVMACRQQCCHVGVAQVVQVVMHRIAVVVRVVRAGGHLHNLPCGRSRTSHNWWTRRCEHGLAGPLSSHTELAPQ